MSYQIKVTQFEGPLNLLLELIEKEKLDVTRLSLAEVTDQYLEYIENRENISLANLADFLSVASKLILIKSKALLPFLELSDDEEEEIKDLEWQLAEYRKFREVSKKFEKMFENGRTNFSRESFLGIGSFFYPPENVNIFDLKNAYQDVLRDIPVIEKLEEEMVKEVITLEEKINHLQGFIRKKIETSFSEIVSGASDKVDVIVSFLAMLEMVKQRILSAEQNGIFQEIKLKHRAKEISQ